MYAGFGYVLEKASTVLGMVNAFFRLIRRRLPSITQIFIRKTTRGGESLKRIVPQEMWTELEQKVALGIRIAG